MKIVLASTSKFKSDILSRVHIKHECMSIDYEENSDQSNYIEYVKELALGKAMCLKDKVEGIIIGIDNVVVCNDEVIEKPESIEEARSNLIKASNNVSKVVSGLAIIDTIKLIKSDVSTICVGMAASMAAFLLASGKKGKRYALKNSEVMIHQPLGGASGQATEIKIAAERILKLKSRLNKILASNTGKPLKKIEKDTERDYFLDSSDALEYGIIDEILMKK